MVYIKLDLDYEILNLGIVEFILIYQFLSLVDCVCILVVNFGYFGLRPIVIWAHFNWRNLSD